MIDEVDSRWNPISDLPDDFSSLASTELKNLAPIWIDQANRLKSSDALSAFNERLAREWSIETGIIENLYSIDRGITELLIERGLEASYIPHGATDKPAEQVVEILRDHRSVLDGLFDFVASKSTLTVSYVEQLHQAMTRSQDSVLAMDQFGHTVNMPLIRGDWKRLPNNPTRPNGPVHSYCPPEHVPSEMKRLIAMHKLHQDNAVPPEVESAWLHHRFTQIHPFQDGNGRVARALASLILLRAGWFPLVISRDDREDYIVALEAADSCDLAPLIKLFSRAQKRAFVRSLALSENVLQNQEPLHEVLNAAADRLKARHDKELARQKLVFDHAESLKNLSFEKFLDAASQIEKVVKEIDPSFTATAERSDISTDFWFRRQIISVAKSLRYFADSRTYRSWTRIKIREERQVDIVVSFHSLGVYFLGILAASSFIEFRDRNEDGEINIDGPYILCDEVFQFNYNEDISDIQIRFSAWLQSAMVTGLDQWRRQI